MADNHISKLLILITFHHRERETQNQSLKRAGQILGQHKSSGQSYTSSYLLQVLHIKPAAGKLLIKTINNCHSELIEWL
jgi:hypothetical protein